MKKQIALFLLSFGMSTALARVPLQSTYQLPPDAKVAGLLNVIEKKAKREESTDDAILTLIEFLAATDQAGLDVESTEEVQDALRNTDFEKHWKEYNSLYRSLKRNIIDNPMTVISFLIQSGYFGYKAYKVYSDPRAHQESVVMIPQQAISNSRIIRNFMAAAAREIPNEYLYLMGQARIPIQIAATLDELLPNETEVPRIENHNKSVGQSLCIAAASLLCLTDPAKRAIREWSSQDRPPLTYFMTEDELELERLEQERLKKEKSELEKLEQEQLEERLQQEELLERLELERLAEETKNNDGWAYVSCALAPIALVSMQALDQMG